MSEKQNDKLETESNLNDEVLKKPVKKKKKKPALIILIIIVSVGMIYIIGTTIMNFSKGANQVQNQMAEAGGDGIFKVKRQDIEQEIISSGDVIGIDKKAYTSPVSAKVEQIRVEVGQTVKKGDVLLTYDATDLGDDLEKVKIQAQSDRAAGNESYEQANKAAGKVSDANKKIKSLKDDIKKLKKEIGQLTDKIEIYEEKMNAVVPEKPADNEGEEKAEEGETESTAESQEKDTQAGLSDKDKKTYKKLKSDLQKKNESLASKQQQMAEQESIVAANEGVTVSESTKAQISATNRLSDMNINAAQDSYDAAEAGITAEASGIIESVQIAEGAFANETQTLLTVIDGKNIGVEFTISKDDLGSIAQGQKARVVISGREYEGTVDFVSRVASAGTQLSSENAGSASIRGRIVLDEPDDKIYIGVSAKVYIFVGESKQTLVVPYGALNTDIDGDYVYVVNKENLIERKDVTIGIFSDEYYEIKEGIEEGDQVITSVTKDMKPGDEYTPAAAMPTGM